MSRPPLDASRPATTGAHDDRDHRAAILQVELSNSCRHLLHQNARGHSIRTGA